VIGPYRIHGHAIVSDDDRIADANGAVPASLRNEADWTRFQHALDQAILTVLGRRGHEANPNVKNRNRLVLSSSARGVERRQDAWWWNPASAPIEEAFGRATPEGGVVAVPGGRAVFDLFLRLGFDEFHLARALSVTIPGGIPIFTEAARGRTAEEIMRSHGLAPRPPELIDAAAPVSLTVWRRKGA
jgi:hypothetical protein